MIRQKLNVLEILPKMNHPRQIDPLFVIDNDPDTDHGGPILLGPYPKFIGYFSENCISQLIESIENLEGGYPIYLSH
jgi:hypothetical protein